MSKIDICNKALGFVGTGRIVSLDEDSHSANVCNLYYDEAVQSVLREHPWNFAERWDILNPVDVPDSYFGRYGYAYVYPEKCVAVHYLNWGCRKTKLFKVVKGLTRRLIVTNIPNAVAVCTADVQDVNYFDPSFLECVSYKLAALIVVAITRDPSRLAAYEEKFQERLAKAKEMDAKEGESFKRDDFQWDGGHERPWTAEQFDMMTPGPIFNTDNWWFYTRNRGR